MRASAELFYGIDLGELVDAEYQPIAPQWWQDAEESEDGLDWEAEYARRRGWLPAPFPADYPEDWRLLEEYKKSSPEFAAWSAATTEKHRIVNESPVILGIYGYFGGLVDTQWAIQVRDSVVTACGAKSVNLRVPPLGGWDDAIHEFARFMELPELVPCGWVIAASYG